MVLAPAIAKWLRGCGTPDVAVGGIAWRKVLQPNKKVRCGGAVGFGGLCECADGALHMSAAARWVSDR